MRALASWHRSPASARGSRRKPLPEDRRRKEIVGNERSASGGQGLGLARVKPRGCKGTILVRRRDRGLNKVAVRKTFISFRLKVFLLAVAAGDALADPPTPVEAVDLQRYLGRWYEIAALPNFFQRKCVRDTTADYRLRDDRLLTVTTARVSVLREASGARAPPRFPRGYFVWVHPVETPTLRWRWRIENLIQGGDLIRKRGDDLPARLHVCRRRHSATCRTVGPRWVPGSGTLTRIGCVSSSWKAARAASASGLLRSAMSPQTSVLRSARTRPRSPGSRWQPIPIKPGRERGFGLAISTSPTGEAAGQGPTGAVPPSH